MKLIWRADYGKKKIKESGVKNTEGETTQGGQAKLVEPELANLRVASLNPQHTGFGNTTGGTKREGGQRRKKNGSNSKGNVKAVRAYNKPTSSKARRSGGIRRALGIMKSGKKNSTGVQKQQTNEMATSPPSKAGNHSSANRMESIQSPISMPVALAVTTAVDVDNVGRRIKEVAMRHPGFYDSDSSSGDEELLLEDGLEDDVFNGPERPREVNKPVKLSKHEVLLQVPFFKQFKEEHRNQLAEQLVEQTFQDGETIVRQNHQGDRFYVILDGEAVVSSTQPDGKEVDITHIYTGDYFGEMSLIYGGRRVANVTSVGTTKCMYLMKETFDRFEEIRLFLILRKVPLLSELSNETQLAISRKLKPVNFQHGQYVVKQGDKGDAFYMITKGSAVVTEGGVNLGTSEDQFNPDPAGSPEKVITHLYEGHTFGEMALLSEEVRVASVRAVDRLTCMRLEARDFKRLLGDEEFAQLLERENKKIVHLRERRTMQQVRPDTASPRHMSSVGSHSSMVREQRKLTRAVTITGEKVINGFVMLHEIGRGTYGRVNLCRKANTGEYFAIKTIDKSPFSKSALKSRHVGSLEDMKREVAIMKKLAHPNVVNLFEVIDDPAADQLYLIQEYCSKGAIMPDLANSAPFPEEKARQYFRMLLSGLDYLHYENVIHRDIKPMNLLLTEDGVLKISDFGAARVLVGQGDQLIGVAGTPAFMAPELLSIDTAQYSGPAVDLWSCGATLYMMVIGSPPWMADDELTLAYRVKNDELDFPLQPMLDPHLKSLINNLLIKDATRRMDLAQAMCHSWVTEEGTNELPRYVASEAFDQDASLRRSLTEDERNEAITRLRQNSLQTSNASFSTVSSDLDPFSSFRTGSPEPRKAPPPAAPDRLMPAPPRPLSPRAKPPGSPLRRPGAKRLPGASTARAMQSGRERSHTTETIEIDLGDNIHRVEDVEDLSDDESGTDGEELFAPKRPSTPPSRLGPKPKRLSDHTLDIGRMHSFVDRKLQEEVHKQGLDPGAGELGPSATARSMRQLGLHPVPSPVHELLHLAPPEVGGKKRRPSSAPFAPVDASAAATLLSQDPSQDPSLGRLGRHVTLVRAHAGMPIPWARLLVGVGEYQGIRPTMEDTTCFVPMLGGKTFFCGVFDGHGGSYVAERLKHDLHTTIAARSTFQTDLHLAIRRGCHAFDRKLLHEAAQIVIEHQDKLSSGESCRRLTRTKGEPKPGDLHHEGHRAGSTAVFAFVRTSGDSRRFLTVGWVGDSRAVLSRGGEAVRLSQDHKASRADETKRIRSCSGTVDRQGRLYGDLAVSRAFGNLQHKGRNLRQVVEQGPTAESSDDESQAQGPLVATPDAETVEVTEEMEFVLMASDGVWDVFTDQEAVNFVRYQLFHDPTASVHKAATELMNKAFMRGSVDNMSCVIVAF